MWCSKAPSEPKRLPEAIRTPARSPARASAAPDSPAVEIQSASPPEGIGKLQSGRCAGSAVAKACAVARSRASWYARTAGSGSPSSSAAISWSSTGVPTSL